jgi:hypothetical protein
MSKWMTMILPTFAFCSGCGTYVPPIDYTFDDDFKAGAFINTVVSNVRCHWGMLFWMLRMVRGLRGSKPGPPKLR